MDQIGFARSGLKCESVGGWFNTSECVVGVLVEGRMMLNSVYARIASYMHAHLACIIKTSTSQNNSTCIYAVAASIYNYRIASGKFSREKFFVDR